jgi:Flp pilus assembly protein TadG
MDVPVWLSNRHSCDKDKEKKAMITKKRERGQSLVELSVSLLVLLYLLSGAAEFGIAFFQYVQLRDAAQEGALYGSMNPTSCANILSRVQGASSSPIDLSTAATTSIQINNNDCGSGAYNALAFEGCPITVTVSYDHNVFMPFMSKIIGPTIHLRGIVTDTILTPAPAGAPPC